MKQDMAETVDAALARQAAGEGLPQILEAFPDEGGSLAALLRVREQLALLVEESVPELDPAADRAAFLKVAAARRRQRSARKAVSFGPLLRLKEWMVKERARLVTGHHALKERKMSAFLVKAALALILAVGSIGGTVAVSADSLPGSPVYPVKLAVEDARLALNADPAGDADLHLAYAQERVQEMERVMEGGGAPDQASLNRLQLHLEEALHLAAQQPDEKMKQLMVGAQHVIQTQEALMAQRGEGEGAAVALQLRAAQGMLHRVRQQIEEGLQDPNAFRSRYGAGRPEAAPPQPDVEPGAGPPITHTQPITSPQGAPDGYGPGPGSGPGEPGGNPDCVVPGECEPAGEQYQHRHEGDPPGPPEDAGHEDAGAGPGSGPAGEQNDVPGSGDHHHGDVNGQNGGDNGASGSNGGGDGGGGGNGGH